MVNAPVEAFTVHTLEGAAEYDTDPRAPLGAVTLGAAEPNVTDEALYRNPAQRLIALRHRRERD